MAKPTIEKADMSTQLNYSYITQPNPGYLIAGQPAELVFTVSNPGSPVTLNSLAFTFPYGSAASDLCASVSDVSATALPGTGWTAGTDKDGNFALTPPGGSVSVDTKGLTFTLSIQVNGQVGVVNLNSSGPVQSFSIEETTSAGKAYWSPPDPLSKFPMGFVFSNLIATPSIVQEGGPIVLSWTGTAGATYTIDWTDAIYSGGQPPITNYQNTVFPPQGTGETLSAGPSPTAVVSVKAAYTTGSQTLHAGPLSVAVGVKLNAPTITSFTATWQGAVLELAWATENAAPNGVAIPAITSEALLANGSYPFTPSSTQPLPSSITLIATNLALQTASQTLTFPTIASFTATWQEAQLLLAWQTANAVVVQIPSITPDALLASGTFLFTPSGKQPLPSSITLTAIGQACPPTSRTLVQGSYVKVAGTPVPVGKQPSFVAVSPDGTRVFVANGGDDTLTVLDAGTLKISGSPVSVGDTPISVAVSPDGARVYVVNMWGNNLTVLDAGTLKPIAGSPVSVGRLPYSVAVSPDGTRVFVASFDNNTLAVLVAGTLQPIVSVGDSPVSVAVSPDGARVFVANFGGNTLTVLDAGTLKPIIGSPVSVGANPCSVAVSPDGTRVFVANEGDNTLTVLDAGTLKPISGSPVQVGKQPYSVAVSPDGTRVSVANEGDNTLTVLDAGTLKPISGSPVSVGVEPFSVAVSPDGARVFVANEGDNTLTVLTPAFVPTNG